MKILQVASGDFFSTYGGGQVYVKNIVDEMISMQINVCVLSFVSFHHEVKAKQYKGIPLYEIGTGLDEDIEKVIDILHPDVIHTHSHKALVCSIGKRKNIPVVVTSHHGGILCPAGTLLDCDDAICYKHVSINNCTRCCLRNIRTGLYWYPLVSLLSNSEYVKLGHWLQNKPFVPFISPIGGVALAIERKKQEWNTIIEKCTLMIAPSYAMADAMTMRGLNKEKLKVVPHGIPMPDITIQEPTPIQGKLKFFYVGRICYVKGIHVLLNAFHQVLNPDIELHLIGGSGNKGEEKYMKLLQKQYAKDKRIVWHGKVPPTEVYQTIKDFHISSSSSSFMEAFGLNISESLAMGKPVLATRCGGAEIQIKDGVNGWLVPTNDASAMKAKIEEIIAHKASIPKMSEQCPKTVVYLHEHCKQLQDIYNTVVK